MSRSRISSLLPSAQLCFNCKKCAQRSQTILALRRYSQPAIRYDGSKSDPRVSAIESIIRESGQIPELPTEPIVELPPIAGQSRTRKKNKNIVKGDLQATIEAHHAANTLAHGNIHLNLEDGSFTGKKLEVTPPVEENLIRTLAQPPSTKQKKQSNNSGWRDYLAGTTLNRKIKHLSKKLDPDERFTQEVKAFQLWIQPSSEELEFANRAFDELKKTVEKQFPEYVLELHGSQATGLAKPTSDIDVRLAIKHLETKPDRRGPSVYRPFAKRQFTTALKRVGKWLKENHTQDYNITKYLAESRIPLLEMQSNKYRMQIQIGATNMPTVHSTEFSKYYQTEYPQIRPLFYLLRWWAQERHCADASQQGISSYLMFNMILTSITHSKTNHDQDNLLLYLKNFFKFWSEADIANTGFAADPARTFPKYATNIVEDNQAEQIDDLDFHPFDPVARSEGSARPTKAMDGTESDLSKEEDNLESLETRDNEANSSETSLVLDKPCEEPSDVYLDGIKFLTNQMKVRRARFTTADHLLLQDPADPRNNIGLSFSRWKTVQKLMQESLEKIELTEHIWNQIRGDTPSYQRLRNDFWMIRHLVFPMNVTREDTGGWSTAIRHFEKRRAKIGIPMPTFKKLDVAGGLYASKLASQ